MVNIVKKQTNQNQLWYHQTEGVLKLQELHVEIKRKCSHRKNTSSNQVHPQEHSHLILPGCNCERSRLKSVNIQMCLQVLFEMYCPWTNALHILVLPPRKRKVEKFQPNPVLNFIWLRHSSERWWEGWQWKQHSYITLRKRKSKDMAWVWKN